MIRILKHKDLEEGDIFPLPSAIIYMKETTETLIDGNIALKLSVWYWVQK